MWFELYYKIKSTEHCDPDHKIMTQPIDQGMAEFQFLKPYELLEFGEIVKNLNI